jgi:membrane-bound metal-dependent hydrolase YbcI (DUF457 family)
MVFTVLHYLAVAPLQFKFKNRVDPFALALSTILIDIEPLTGFFTGNYHWLLHSFTGAGLFSVLLAFTIFFLEKRDSFAIRFFYRLLRLERRRHGFGSTLLTSLFGGVSHVFIDAFTHRSFPYVLFPFKASENPFWRGFEIGHLVQAIAVLLSLCSVYLWVRSIRELPHPEG